MATYTSYLNLKKPDGGERYALADFNANMQKIDEAFAHLIDPSSGASDLNNCKTLGFYRSSPSASNNPISGYFSILVVPFVGNRDVAQIAIEVNTNRTFVRTFHDNTTWTAWKELGVENSDIKWKYAERENITQNASGSDYWTITGTSFPAIAGYSRRVVGISTNNRNVIATGGYDIGSDGMVTAYVYSTAAPPQQYTLSAIYLYLPDTRKLT